MSITRRAIAAIAALGLAPFAATGAETPVSLTIDPSRVVGQIDERIYGHFLEHIYHSCNGGLWGEIVWNRSFEETLTRDDWRVTGGCLETPRGGPREPRFTFGEGAWRDYEFSVEARKTSGTDGLLIGVRSDRNSRYTLVLGAGGNQRHDLERAVNNRQTRRQDVSVPKTAPGQIESGRWYRVRVRCEGQHLRTWLDGQPLLDFTDKGGPASGQVSVGARNEQAQFRNFRVEALDGKVLFAALPALARHWQVVGAGEVSLDAGQPLNSRSSMRIVSDAGETGLVQNRLCIRKGDACRGSLWLRGEASDGIVVRLLDGQRTLAENTLPAPTAEWKEYPLEFSPDATAENATLQIVTRGKAAIWLDQVSLMPDSARATGGFRPDLLQAVADLRPPVIRWPGGSFVGGYNWKNGIGPQHKRIEKRGWDELDPLSFGIDEFVAMCRNVGSEPLVVVHVGPGNQPEKRPQFVQDACDWVEYCNGPATSKWGAVRAANGHPEPYRVKYWEIDNEVWGMKPEDYAGIVKQFVPAMKKVDPAIVTIACGSGQLGRNWGAGDLAVINECADVVDYLSIHHYESPDRFADGPANAEKFWASLGDLIARSKNPKLKLYVSEWNAQSTDWRTGLYAGGLLNAFERNQIVGMAGPALWLRHVSAPAWDNAFINFDHRTWFPAPNYVVMKLWRDHFAPNLLGIAGDLSGLNANATKSADGKHVFFKVVNPTDRAVDVRLQIAGGFDVTKAGLELVAPDELSARNTLDERDAVRVANGEVELTDNAVRFALPRWSAAVVSLDAGA